MAKRGKKYNKAIEFINPDMAYSVDEAIELLEKTNTVKFDPTVEIHFNLNLDPKYQDQMIRTTITLPHGTGKKPKICVFNDSASADELKNLGADVVGNEELIEDISTGKQALDFDVCIATPSMMRNLGKIARVLGPKGLMPNPKTGTVGEDLVAIVKEIAAGKFEFKTDKQGNIHSLFGKLSFGATKLKDNLNHFLQTIQDVKPSGAKGKYINTIYVCNAMGPGIKLDLTK
ncbi:50S ribosomal protein L1 [Candidatus Gracilibacteria bacterium]|nr:50S ribosomal protein L1 [Candidatus Gracilibacteria bacterium]NUJ98807.1 50S ribosomal protein L1 [Candidatus Gracilibacteria bacterium]